MSSEFSPVKGLSLTSEALPHHSTCPGCQAGKAKRRSYKASSSRPERSTHPLERIHSDLVGPFQTTSINGHHFAVSFTCEYSSHVWSLPLKTKSETLGTFKVFCAQVKSRYGFSIKYFRSDRGGEFMGKEFSDFLASEGIIRETSAPNTPQQNGLAERMQQTIWSGVRAILHRSGMKNGFWSEAMAVIVHSMNRSPNKRMDWRTPHETLTGQVPNIAYFRTFGCRAWVHNNKGRKLDAKSLPMIFVGYEAGSKAYRLWNPSAHKIAVSSDVTFNETVYPNLPVVKPEEPVPILKRQELRPNTRSEGKQKQVAFIDPDEFYLINDDTEDEEQFIPSHVAALSPQAPNPNPSSAGSSPGTSDQALQPASPGTDRFPSPRTWRSPTPMIRSDSDDEVEAMLTPPDETQDLSLIVEPSDTPAPVSNPPTPSTVAYSLSEYSSPELDSVHSASELPPLPKRSERKGKGKTKLTKDEKVQKTLDEAYCHSVEPFVTATSHGEPRSYNEAVDPHNPDHQEWITAIQAELKSLQDHGTWEVVPRPEGKHIVSCKWVWRIKVKEDGSIERYKARLVARGFTQIQGVDFNETFAPVTRLDTLRLLAATAVEKNWEFRQINVKTAYLYGKLEEEVYMAIPQGLGDVPEGHVLKLKKALYGLKQAGRQWYKELRGHMEKFGMKLVESDPHTFIFSKVINQERKTLIVPVYVDDLFPFGDKVLVDEFEQYIPEYLETSPPCNTHYFLGIRVTRNWSPATNQPFIAFDQIVFINAVLAAIEVLFRDTITVRNVCLPAAEIIPNPMPKITNDPKLVRCFQSAVGQLMYIMLATRPDLAYPIGMLARHASNPSPDHVKALLHLAGYLKKTKNEVLVYRAPEPDNRNPGTIEAYCDADWAGEEHSGRSTTGFVVYKSEAPICWMSKRQGVVSRSTMESEYIALFKATEHVLLFAQLEEQMFIENTIPIVWCDNQAAIAVAKGGEMTFKRSRFMNVKYHFVRHVFEKGLMQISWVNSETNTADIFTKRLTQDDQDNHRDCMLETCDNLDLNVVE